MSSSKCGPGPYCTAGAGLGLTGKLGRAWGGGDVVVVMLWGGGGL